MKKFIIVLHTGKRYEVEKKSKDKLSSWLNTGVAGILPIRGNFIPLIPSKIKEIIEIVEESKK